MSVKNNPVIYLAAKTWHYSKGNRPKVVLYFTLCVIANLIGLLETLVIAWLLNTIQTQGLTPATFPTLIGDLALLVLINAGFWMFHGPSRVLETVNAFLVRANYKEYLLQGTMDLPVEWHADHHSGDTIDKIEKGSNALFNYAQDTFMVIESVVKLIGSYVALVYFNFDSIYIVLAMVLFTIWMILKFDKVLIVQLTSLFKTENTIAAKVYDAISNINTVIILRVEKLVLKSIAKRMRQPVELFTKNTAMNETKWFLVTMCSVIMTFLIVGSYLFTSLRLGSVIAIGTIYALYGYVQRITDLFYRFAYMYGDNVRQKTQVMNAEELAKDFRSKMIATEIGLSPQWREVTVKNLQFSYQIKEGTKEYRTHLDNVSFTMHHGEKIALVGASGSGKTTLLKIIRSLYEPKKMQIAVDGKKMGNSFAAISEQIALIPQEPEIFATTIKENITIGVEHSLAHVKTFTDMARFTAVAERLPKKFNSSIVEKGVNLSGGEKQRLALARGLMACADKEIILLDEPTSSVDFRNELLIYQSIFEKFKNKTIVSSVHRLHLLPLFDTIFVLSNGKIVASGSFKELSAHSKVFQEMWEKDKSGNRD